MPDFMERRRLTRLLDRTSDHVANVETPEKGWVATMRAALGMSADAVARRKGVSRNAVYQAERSEKDGAISLKQMEQLAAAMGGRFVYAIVPQAPIDELKFNQSRRRALLLAQEAPEFDDLSTEEQQDWLDDTSAHLLHDMPSDFWDQE